MQLDADRYPLLYSLRGALSPARKNAKAARQAAAKRRAWTAEYSQLVFSLIADDGPGHDRDGPGRRRSRRPLRRAAAGAPPAFSGGVTDFMALGSRADGVWCRSTAPGRCPWDSMERGFC